MRKFFTCFTAVLILCLLALALSTPVVVRVVKAADLQEKCDQCNLINFQQYEHCTAIHGLDDVRCSDQFNEGVVHCFRNFCEQ